MGSRQRHLPGDVCQRDDGRAGRVGRAADRLEAAVPLRRIGQSNELDAAFAYLASAASSYMTGQALIVDGGAGL
jgi:NAD(P)-dependent dehydrogenase (short-subunit alcohol dehydrogenase family)